MPEFWEWFTKQYLAYRGSAIGQERSISDFAKEIGIPQSTASRWMKKDGTIPRKTEHITALVRYFGPVVYSLLKLPLPESSFSLDSLPTELQTVLVVAVEEINKRLGSIDPDSPEGDALVRSILKKHGFVIEKVNRSSE